MSEEKEIDRRNGWNEWSRHVLAELQRLDANQVVMNEAIIKLTAELANSRGDIKLLYFKASAAGLVAGAIPALVALALVFIR